MSANLMSLARSGGKFLKLFGDGKMMKILPYDAEVEYLESTGTQWIDTGYTAFQCPYFSFDVQPLITNVDSAMFGAYTDGYTVQQFQGRWRWFDGGWTLTDIPVDITRTTNITKNANGWFVDGEITKTSSGLRGNLSLVLFGINTKNGLKSGTKSLRVNQLSLFDKNSILVADFIPIRKGNIGYMYDRVSGQLFGNSGTGAFIIGPDKTI